MKKRRVVVTGLGVVSSVGIGKEDFWKGITSGKSGISEVTLFDTSKFNRHLAGEVKNFHPHDFMPKETAKFLGRASQFAVAATKLALEDAWLPFDEFSRNKTGIIVGTTMAEAHEIDVSTNTFLKQAWDDISLQRLLNLFSPSISRNIGYFLNTSGTNLLLPNACAAGNYAIGYGHDLIKAGEIDYAIVGGAEALSRIAFQGFQRLYAMSPDVCSPFDKNRKGMILSEGAGILLLETLEHALARKARIYAEVLGYGLSCDAHHMTMPKRDGVKKAMKKALKNAGVTANEIDYINAHGTGTPANDKEEAGAIKEVFGPAYGKVPVSSIKSMLGHSLGAASALEAIACCLAIKDGVIPPTVNLETQDPECDIDCVPNTARKAKVTTALNHGFAFGGNNCCTVFNAR